MSFLPGGMTGCLHYLSVTPGKYAELIQMAYCTVTILHKNITTKHFTNRRTIK